ncbi:MAG: hypothetical protein N2V72_00310 [Methanophagales archaeon]|nr:hypothetical protein [Methanophagales archaeon]
MTGRSDLSKGCLKYYRWLTSGVLLVSGFFLIVEHFVRFGGFDIELAGHEWYGLGLIILAMLLSLKWKQLPALLRAIRERDLRAILDEGERGDEADSI